MTYANHARDGEILRDVCLMSKEMWQVCQQVDDILIDWDQLNDLVHQTFAASAAKSVGVQGKEWRDLLHRYRAPGQTMLQLCSQAQLTAS